MYLSFFGISLMVCMSQNIEEWTNKTCGRQSLSNLKGYGLL